MRKYLAISVSVLGLLLAGQALAAASAPATGTQSAQGSQAQGSATAMPAQMPNGAFRTMPCPMMLENQGNVMYGQGPCGDNYMYARTWPGAAYGFAPEAAAWLGLMSILTVVLVWVVLLLLIAVLWRHLTKHEHR